MKVERQHSISEEDFRQIGLVAFFDTDDDKDIDWEECFALIQQSEVM